MNLNSIPELYRKEAVSALFTANTFRNCWPIWKSKIQEILGDSYTEIDIINLGDHLTDIFRTTSEDGRGQSSLSGGGAAWESLVCWYINLCSIGSRTVAVKKMSLVPLPIQKSITVNYGNFACNTESDITVITFPNQAEYLEDINTLQVLDSGSLLEPIIRDKMNHNLTNFLSARDFDNYEIGVIQCKTNWNDNAQIPMLWDMIYSANGFRGRNITIGKDGFNIHDAANFTYSFVTVPSNQRTVFKSASVAVKRVNGLSGGNYWGQPTEQLVARSVKEIFNNNFQTGYETNLRTDVRNYMPLLSNRLIYFDII